MRMIKEVRFYEFGAVEDPLLKFAVILARAGGKWVFCKHRERTTLEVPGGHREPGETVDETAARVLREETGAKEFTLRPICVYSVVRDDAEESFGGLYAAEIFAIEGINSEIEKILLMDQPPVDGWTYPDIQPKLLEEAGRRGAVT